MGGFVRHDYKSCRICSEDSHGCSTIKEDLQQLIDNGDIQIFRYRNENDVNMIGCYLHELSVSDINSVTPEVNDIIPHFNMPERIDVKYNNPRVHVSPLIICLLGPVP